MISYREKQLLMVQKMLQEEADTMLSDACRFINEPTCREQIKFEDDGDEVESYEDLVALAERKGYDTYIRVEDILSAEELEEIDRRKEEIDERFGKKTGILHKTDLAFLSLAIALQCVRQYVLTSFPERLDDQEAAKEVKNGKEEHSNRRHRLYRPSKEEIMTNPVPFDANIGSNGALAGGGRLGHRATAIGHDPIVGLVIGTANIATSTLTTWNMKSYHIQTVNKRDCFGKHASTAKILYYTKKRLLDEGIEGKNVIIISLLKEIEHLYSDLNSKRSLPIPIISTYSPQLASQLADYGVDMGNLVAVGKQATYAVLINELICWLHGLCFCVEKDAQDDDYEKEKRLYEVRTRKIIMYSNIIASSSNILYSVLSGDYNKLDIGGILVTISGLFSDIRFMKKVQQEFIDEEISEEFQKRLKSVELCI